MYRNTQWIDEVKDQDTEEVIQEEIGRAHV